MSISAILYFILSKASIEICNNIHYHFQKNKNTPLFKVTLSLLCGMKSLHFKQECSAAPALHTI